MIEILFWFIAINAGDYSFYEHGPFLNAADCRESIALYAGETTMSECYAR